MTNLLRFHASRAGILALIAMGVAVGPVMSASAHSAAGFEAAASGASPQSYRDDGYRHSDQGRLVCRDVLVQKERPHQDQHRIAGTAIGAVAGGLLGNQIGSGRGRTLATVGGAVAGGYAGNRVQAHHQDRDTYTVRERRCYRQR